MDYCKSAVLDAAWRAVRETLPDQRARPRPRVIDEGVPAPVLRFPVISHDDVLRILADKPGRV